MFIISLNYTKELSEVDQHIEAHVAYLKQYYENGTFVISGKKEPRTGGVILANCKSRELLDNIIKEDPFFQHDIAEYHIIEFVPTVTADGFDSLKALN